MTDKHDIFAFQELIDREEQLLKLRRAEQIARDRKRAASEHKAYREPTEVPAQPKIGGTATEPWHHDEPWVHELAREMARLPAPEATKNLPALHLSDGGHFENLGLYELVRRHCRYVIVSDAGEDADLAFDDLGNAIRRVREDFSVEIDLDVDRLRTVNGLSQQHVAVGTIHYDGLSGSDKGTLIYLKPTVVGGEPPDVNQYRARNAKFPHEGTADQFYDEAQWESYRRLGEYIAAVAFHVDDTGWLDKPNPVDALFLAVKQRWHAAPARQAETFLGFTDRCSALESEIRANAPLAFRVEMFPELAFLQGQAKREAEGPATLNETLDETSQVVTWVMQLAQLMEDVWVGAELDTYWSHPLNEGWMAYFHRWANTPSFRRWWPLLRPIYSDGFRNFVKHRFELHVNHDTRPSSKLVVRSKNVAGEGMASRAMARFQPDPELPPMRWDYELTLEGEVTPLQVGVLRFAIDEKDHEKTARWSTQHLHVPPWLIGAGIIARFLKDILSELAKNGFTQAIVHISGSERDPAQRSNRASIISFYKSRGFAYLDPKRLIWKAPAAGSKSVGT